MTSHALTIDLEDWHQLFYRRITGELCKSKRDIVTDVQHLLDLLDELNIRATFFVVGMVAADFPELVRSVAQRGHEIGSHTYHHKLINSMELADFKADIEQSRKQLQDLTGQPILGFRAPEFSVGSLQHGSFFEVLAEVGFQYDSSIFPFAGVRYGIPDASRYPFSVETPSGVIREFPLATWNFGPYRLPVAGGTYFRFLPPILLRRVLADFESSGYAGVFYFHPYEFHCGWLYLSGLSWRHRLQLVHMKYTMMHNIFTRHIQERLRLILTKYHFLPLEEVYHNESNTK